MNILNVVIAFTLPGEIIDALLAFIAAILGWFGSKWHTKFNGDK